MVIRSTTLIWFLLIIKLAKFQEGIHMEETYAKATKSRIAHWQISQGGNTFFEGSKSTFLNLLLDDNSNNFYFTNEGKIDQLNTEVVTIGSLSETFDTVNWSHTLSKSRFDGNFVFFEKMKSLIILDKSNQPLVNYFTLLDSQSGTEKKSFRFSFQNSDSFIYDVSLYKSLIYFLVKDGDVLQQCTLDVSLSYFKCVFLNDYLGRYTISKYAWNYYSTEGIIQSINHIIIDDSEVTALMSYDMIRSDVQYSCIFIYDIHDTFNKKTFGNLNYFQKFLKLGSRVLTYGSSDYQLSQSMLMNVDYPEDSILVYNISRFIYSNNINSFDTKMSITSVSYTINAFSETSFSSDFESKYQIDDWRTYIFMVNQQSYNYALNILKKENMFDLNFFGFLNDTKAVDYVSDIEVVNDFGNGTTMANFNQSIIVNNQCVKNEGGAIGFEMLVRIYEKGAPLDYYVKDIDTRFCYVDHGLECDPYKYNKGAHGFEYVYRRTSNGEGHGYYFMMDEYRQLGSILGYTMFAAILFGAFINNYQIISILLTEYFLMTQYMYYLWIPPFHFYGILGFVDILSSIYTHSSLFSILKLINNVHTWIKDGKIHISSK